ncbi:hypothetical protein BD413DRAFT_503069 [Trametes elegans]|nr:hypothetical protein BD413DRAFT_503069 [Trametes elegans]
MLLPRLSVQAVVPEPRFGPTPDAGFRCDSRRWRSLAPGQHLLRVPTIRRNLPCSAAECGAPPDRYGSTLQAAQRGVKCALIPLAPRAWGWRTNPGAPPTDVFIISGRHSLGTMPAPGVNATTIRAIRIGNLRPSLALVGTSELAYHNKRNVLHICFAPLYSGFSCSFAVAYNTAQV